MIEKVGLLSSRQRLVLLGLTLLWVLANGTFWDWWFHQQVGSPVLFGLFSVATFYIVTFLPSMYLFYVWNMAMAQPIPAITAVKDCVIREVAMITLTVVGAEDISVVEKQLIAMQAVTYPHDSWLLVDGSHSPRLEALCERYGVDYFCRHDVQKWGAERVAHWNAPEAPFKRKTKAGNVNAWLDMYGLGYSHFTQLDIDHNPIPAYLDKVLGYFADDRIKWVQGPSVYKNLDNWIARGSAEQELVLQGPLQSGFFGWSMTPFIIGSHCTYETRAVQEIGGFQPTRAEDHLDTVELAAIGYRGVFVPEIIAEGDGPETFATYMQQQFAWAYSLMQILFWHTPRLLPKYGAKRVMQFLFAQTWYPLWSGSTLVLFLLPAICILTNSNIVTTVSYLEYAIRSGVIATVGMGIWLFSRPWQQPRGLNLSWRGVILHIARWPIIISALIQVIMKVEKPYMITPKGLKGGEEQFALMPHSVFFILIAINLAAVFLGGALSTTEYFYMFFALQGAVYLYIVYGLVLAKSGWKLSYLLKRKLALAVFAGLSLILVVSAQFVSPLIALGF